MRVFVYESVTGGGMTGQDPAAALVHEADLMIRAVVADLAILPGISLVTTRDVRLSPIDGVETFVVDQAHDASVAFDRGLSVADAVWPIAPETGGGLERLSRRVLEAGRRLLGSSPDSVAIAASKRATVERLAAAGLRVVPTFARPDEVPSLPGPWVVKPDDGAGCEDTIRVPDWRVAQARLRRDGGGLVAQPWIDGEQLSLSLLCHDGSARLLSVNRQELRVADQRLALAGITVNAVADDDGSLAALADASAAALPGLFGLVGIDLVRQDQAAVILEVNPRLTTSYCGLHRALGVNPAALLLQLVLTGALPQLERPLSARAVHLDLELSRVG